MNTNKMALYVLLAALVLAALTNRWLLRGSAPGFNIVSFDGLFFTVQWIACAMTMGGLALLIVNWRATGQFPKSALLGLMIMVYFAATGIPQTFNSYEWAAGNVGLVRWQSAFLQQRQAAKIAPRLIGVWKSDTRTYTIKHDELIVAAAGKTETLSEASCGNAFAFHYATDAVFHSNPAAEPYYKLLEGPPAPAFEAACPGRLYTFLLRADDALLAFRDLHERDPVIEILKRVP